MSEPVHGSMTSQPSASTTKSTSTTTPECGPQIVCAIGRSEEVDIGVGVSLSETWMCVERWWRKTSSGRKLVLG